jgi:hypothetical protein
MREGYMIYVLLQSELQTKAILSQHKQYVDEQYFELYTFYQNIHVGGGGGVWRGLNLSETY